MKNERERRTIKWTVYILLPITGITFTALAIVLTPYLLLGTILIFVYSLSLAVWLLIDENASD